MEIFYRIFNTFAQSTASKQCGEDSGFFGFPAWYRYLPKAEDNCPAFTGLSDTWLVLLALIEILIRIATVAAIIYVIYGAFQYIFSRGNPDKINQARTAIQDALIGLVIAVTAIVIIGFVARRISGV